MNETSIRALIRALTIFGLAVSVIGPIAHSQQTPLERLSTDILDVRPPTARVTGEPGKMRTQPGECRSGHTADIRRRIVDIAIQEWAYFGFNIVDQTIEPGAGRSRPRRRRPWLGPTESARVAASIAGYWSATADGAWIIDRQNRIWDGPMGVAARWRDPWSAAFVSWVMCESGLGRSDQFERSIAHHVYIDQAIQAGESPHPAAFVAHEIGQMPIEPGDLLCSARRPAYRTIADRRGQLGVGARTHCDIVVQIDPARERILTIGGNVRGSVSMKLMAAEVAERGRTPTLHRRVGLGRRVIFAHLKLSADSIGPDGLIGNPTLKALSQHAGAWQLLQQRLMTSAPASVVVAGDNTRPVQPIPAQEGASRTGGS